MRGHMRCRPRYPHISSISREALACPTPVPNRLVPLLDSPCVSSDGAGGCVVRACLLLCRYAVGLRGLASACSAGCRDGVRRFEKKRAGCLFPVRLSVLLSNVIYALAVVVQIALLADDIAVHSAWTDMRIRVAWLEQLAHAEAVRPAFDI